MPERSALGSFNGDQFTLLTKMIKPSVLLTPQSLSSPPSFPPCPPLFATYAAPQCLRNSPSLFTGCVAQDCSQGVFDKVCTNWCWTKWYHVNDYLVKICLFSEMSGILAILTVIWFSSCEVVIREGDLLLYPSGVFSLLIVVGCLRLFPQRGPMQSLL